MPYKKMSRFHWCDRLYDYICSNWGKKKDVSDSWANLANVTIYMSKRKKFPKDKYFLRKNQVCYMWQSLIGLPGGFPMMLEKMDTLNNVFV